MRGIGCQQNDFGSRQITAGESRPTSGHGASQQFLGQ